MKINNLAIKNFKKYADLTIDLHPQFTLLVGENGSGKTTILDALAVAMGIWLVEPPDPTLMNSRRKIEQNEIRLTPTLEGDRLQFHRYLPVVVSATGEINGQLGKMWTRQIKEKGIKTTNSDAEEVLGLIENIYKRVKASEKVICPILGYYGAGRAWLPSNQHSEKTSNVVDNKSLRWSAFYDCFNERIRFSSLNKWFERETIAAVNRGGKMRPGFEVVRQAILGCVPDADRVFYDPDLEQIVLSISGQAQPFDNLSAGQKMMLAMIADIAIKAVTQNAHLLPLDELGQEGKPLPPLLQQTPGIVLIDELDVHLHPKWQRHVASDLKRTFPAIQFVCTSHSPQVIGQLAPEEIRILDGSVGEHPAQSFGMDSNWILKVLMGADEQDSNVKRKLSDIFRLITDKELDEANAKIGELRQQIGNSEAIQRAASTIERIRVLGK